MKVDERKEDEGKLDSPQFRETAVIRRRSFYGHCNFFYDDDGQTLSHFRFGRSREKQPSSGLDDD